MIARLALRNNAYRTATARFYSEGASKNQNVSSASAPSAAQVNVNVPGLSNACIEPASKAVGPGVEPNKSGAYKVPEYFCYNNTTFFEAEVEMSKFRCPQPSALKK